MPPFPAWASTALSLLACVTNNNATFSSCPLFLFLIYLSVASGLLWCFEGCHGLSLVAAKLPIRQSKSKAMASVSISAVNLPPNVMIIIMPPLATLCSITTHYNPDMNPPAMRSKRSLPRWPDTLTGTT
jgi:hypothetical protein